MNKSINKMTLNNMDDNATQYQGQLLSNVQ